MGRADETTGFRASRAWWQDPKTIISLAALLTGSGGIMLVSCGRDAAGYIVTPTIEKRVTAGEVRANAHSDSAIQELHEEMTTGFSRMEELLLKIPAVQRAIAEEEAAEEAAKPKPRIFRPNLRAHR